MVEPQSRGRTKAVVQRCLQCGSLDSTLTVGIQPRPRRHARVGPPQDVGRVRQHLAAISHQHRDSVSATRKPRCEHVHKLQVRSLHVIDSRAIERPPCLLTEMADGDRHQSRTHPHQSLRRHGQRWAPVRAGQAALIAFVLTTLCPDNRVGRKSGAKRRTRRAERVRPTVVPSARRVGKAGGQPFGCSVRSDVGVGADTAVAAMLWPWNSALAW